MALTKQQKLFCEEYIKDYNGTAAYLRSHPKANENTARSDAYKLLKREDIIEYIHVLQAEIVKISAISANKILKELDKIVMSETSSNTDKLRALDIMSKNLNIQNMKTDGEITITIGYKDTDEN